jgi:hypothetical protein
MRNIAVSLIILIVLCGAMAAYYFSDGQTRKRTVRTSLQEFSDAVSTKDRATVSAALTQLLTDDAKIRLEVHFFSIGHGRPMMEQNFDKAQFITFIDNTLYPLTDYSYTPQLTSLDADGKVAFTSVEWADGANMMGGVSVDMRFSSDTSCTGSVTFENDTARLRDATCQLQFRQVPKPGQTAKFQSKEGLMDLLGRKP